MGRYVRYIDDSVKHEMLSRELATEDEALEEAWQLAQGDNEVVAIDEPDEESVPMVQIDAWFESRSATGETGSSSRRGQRGRAGRVYPGLKNGPLLTLRQPLTRLFSSARSICD